MIRGEHGDDKVLPDLSGIILISSSGSQAALDDIAKIHWDRGAVQLRRINEQRIERIEATIDRRIVSKGQVENLVSNDLLPALEAQYPGLTTWDEAIDTN
jgi:multidrug efflux pump subunit AcrB